MITHLGRFTVRDWSPWEGPQLFTMTGNPRVTRYLGFRTHTKVAEAEEMILDFLSSPSRFQSIYLDDDIIGNVGIEIRQHQATLTLMFRPLWKARGAGYEFGSLIAEWIMTHKQIWRLCAYVHVDNMAGQRVAERIGAVREGRLRRFAIFPNVSTEPQDVYAYAIVR